MARPLITKEIALGASHHIIELPARSTTVSGRARRTPEKDQSVIYWTTTDGQLWVASSGQAWMIAQ